jgi:hypothetical protein
MVGVARAANWCPPKTGAPSRTISAFHLHGMASCNVNKIYAANLANPNPADDRSDASMVTLASNPLIHSRSLFAAAMVNKTGLWFSCQMGCCEAQQTF